MNRLNKIDISFVGSGRPEVTDLSAYDQFPEVDLSSAVVGFRDYAARVAHQVVNSLAALEGLPEEERNRRALEIIRDTGVDYRGVLKEMFPEDTGVSLRIDFPEK
ncbi:MAG: hypothetical protein WC796_04450 [Candidatus Pacearchaeota archaeon]|jgi:hypothetical protein